MHRKHICFCVLCAILSAALAAAVFFGVTATADAQAPKGPVSFINDVAPIFKENCFACHDAKKRKGKLDMTTYEGLRKGGDHEDPVMPGKSAESYLYELITTAGPKRMPPKEAGNPLTKEQIAVVDRWIKEGAKLDAVLQPKSDLVRELRVRWKPPQPPAQYKYPAIVNAVAFTPDGQKLIVSGHHELLVWDFNQPKLEKRIYTRAERAYAMVFLPDGKLVVAGGRPGQEGDVRVYDINAGMAKDVDGVQVVDGVNDKAVLIKELTDSDDAILCLSISPDGKRLASGGCDRLVRVWDISNGIAEAKLEQTSENHADWVFGVSLAGDGKHLVTCSRDKTAKVWDLVAKESVLTFPGHQQPVYGVYVKADGKMGYSVGEDNQLRTWNATGDGKQLAAGAGHTKPILKLAADPKGQLLVTGAADNTVRLWNDKGAASRTLAGHTDQVFAVAVSPDASLVASGSYNGEVRVWKAADGSVVKAFIASPGNFPEPKVEAPKK